MGSSPSTESREIPNRRISSSDRNSDIHQLLKRRSVSGPASKPDAAAPPSSEGVAATAVDPSDAAGVTAAAANKE